MLRIVVTLLLLSSVASFGNVFNVERKAKLATKPAAAIHLRKANARVSPLRAEGGDAQDRAAAAEIVTSVPAGGAMSSDLTLEQQRFRGRLLLVAVSFLFGTLNVALRLLYSLPGAPTASVLSFTRGMLAAACFTPIFLDRKNGVAPTAKKAGEGNQRFWLTSLELAFWNFGAQGLLNVGLLFTDAARASFLTQTSVVITPLLSLAAGMSVKRSLWVGCGAALSGLVMLSGGGGGGGGAAALGGGIGGLLKAAISSVSFSLGDLLCLGGAVSWSMYIFRLSSVGDRFPELPLQALKTLLLAGLYGGWCGASAVTAYASGGMEAVGSLWTGWRSLSAWGLLLFSAIGPGALADVLQQLGQSKVSAAEANVILCAEPIFTAVCARILLGELTSPQEKLGGSLIVLAALLASGVFDRKKKD